MQQDRVGDPMVSQISVQPGSGGTVAVYLVETGTGEETRSLASLIEELRPQIDAIQLSRGRLVCYAVKTDDPSILDELESILKSTYAFVLMQRSFDRVIYRIVKQLCADTGSRVLSIPHCNICGTPEPFPELFVTLSDETGKPVMSRSYCGTCTAGLVARTNKDFILSLLSADRRDFSQIEHSELIRSRGRSQGLRYRVRR